MEDLGLCLRRISAWLSRPAKKRKVHQVKCSIASPLEALSSDGRSLSSGAMFTVESRLKRKKLAGVVEELVASIHPFSIRSSFVDSPQPSCSVCPLSSPMYCLLRSLLGRATGNSHFPKQKVVSFSLFL